MARSPFQGTWQPGARPTVVTAPDALVFINGETDLIGCGQCRRRFDLNKYVTSIQVDLSVESAPGSANVSLSIPRHCLDEFLFDGNPIISPMMEIEIFAKGYFLLEGVPQYYPIFWGLTTEVSESYSGGEHTYTINCADILKWWELCMMNVNAAFTQPSGQLGRSLYGNAFSGTNPYDVIWTLAQQSMGDIVLASGTLTSLNRENVQKQTFDRSLGDIMQYWSSRFSRMRSNLLLYGTQGNAIRGDTIDATYGSGRPSQYAISSLVRQANGGANSAQMGYDPTDPGVTAFRTQVTQAGQINLWQSEFRTKLEIANDAKEAIGFEFYMDVTGDIVFKPPFYNLDILGNKPVSWIQDIDVIDWNFDESEAEVVTQLQIQGNFGGASDYGVGEELTPFTSVTDYHLLRRYGWRSRQINSEFLGNDPMVMFYTGMDMLDRMNAKRWRGSVNIPMRPELRLGFPVYIASKDQIWYVAGISHNLTFGGRAQTTLTLTAKRSKFVAPKGIGQLSLTSRGKGSDKSTSPMSDNKPTAKDLGTASFKLDVGLGAFVPPENIDPKNEKPGENPHEPLILRHPKTGRLVGYPNVVMAYTRPFQPSPSQLSNLEGKRDITDKKTDKGRPAPKPKKPVDPNDRFADSAQSTIENAKNIATQIDELKEKYATNRYQYGLNSAGVYVYAHDQSQVIREMTLLPAKNITTTQNGQAAQVFAGSTGMVRPVSDERGFEVIGHYRYGRGVSLRDGALITSTPGGRVEVGIQLALGGDLFASLQAQSQGIVSVSTPYPNPAEAVSKLQPEDLQTAAVISPDGKTPVFTGDNAFADSGGTLDSIGQKGADASQASVEATQLSKALTLAEMSVREDILSAKSDCACLLGRADLAFMNIGFQTKILRDAVPDNTSLRTTEGGVGIIASLSDSEAFEALNSPTFQSSLPKGKELDNRIETFLTKLYNTLDDVHQRVEKELRGELIRGGPDPTQVRNVPPQEVATDIPIPTEVVPFSPGKASPPFNAAGRAMGGDPAALALQGQSAREGIKQTWDSFGDKLRSAGERTKLATEAAQSQDRLTRLQAEKERLERTLAAKGIIVGVDLPKRIAELNKEISAEQQTLAKNQQKMNELNTKYPP